MRCPKWTSVYCGLGSIRTGPKGIKEGNLVWWRAFCLFSFTSQPWPGVRASLIWGTNEEDKLAATDWCFVLLVKDAAEPHTGKYYCRPFTPFSEKKKNNKTTKKTLFSLWAVGCFQQDNAPAPQSENGSQMVREVQKGVSGCRIGIQIPQISVLLRVCEMRRVNEWDARKQVAGLKGSAAHTLVPLTTACIHKPSGFPASMSHASFWQQRSIRKAFQSYEAMCVPVSHSAIYIITLYAYLYLHFTGWTMQSASATVWEFNPVIQIFLCVH